MDKQKRFNEEVLEKVANLNSHIKKLDDILWNIHIVPDEVIELEFKAKDARDELVQIEKVMNEILDKLDDRE